MRNLFFHDAPTDDGGSLETLKDIGKQMGDAIKTGDETSKKVDTLANEIKEMQDITGESDADIKKLATNVARHDAKLESLLGKSGAQDYSMEFAKLIRAMYMEKIGAKMGPDEMIDGIHAKEYLEKAAITFTTTTDATAGYLIPEIFIPTITQLRHAYGGFYPMLTKITAPPGVGVLFNEESAKPVAAWRAAQHPGTLTEEATPMTWGQDTVTSILMYVLITIANEMLANPSLNFSSVATVRMLTAMNRKLEYGVIAGTTGNGEPSDGILADATDQGTMATMSFASLITFLKDCITDDESAEDTSVYKIGMTRWDALTLAGEQGVTAGSLIWGDAHRGIPNMLMGYELITHPAFNNGTAKYATLFDPSAISLVEDPGFGIDMSEHVNFKENKTALRVTQHYDWNLGIVAQMHKKIITA